MDDVTLQDLIEQSRELRRKAEEKRKELDRLLKEIQEAEKRKIQNAKALENFILNEYNKKPPTI